QTLPQRTGQPQRAVSHGETDAGSLAACNRTMIDRVVGDRDVASSVPAVAVGEIAVQNQREFRAFMGMGGNFSTCPDPEQRGVKTVELADVILAKTRKLGAPRHILDPEAD